MLQKTSPKIPLGNIGAGIGPDLHGPLASICVGFNNPASPATLQGRLSLRRRGIHLGWPATPDDPTRPERTGFYRNTGTRTLPEFAQLLFKVSIFTNRDFSLEVP